MKPLAPILLGAMLMAAAPQLARAAGGGTAVDVELVLAVDISYSMDEEEQKLQRQGYIAALTSKEFTDALANGPHGRIAVTYVEWANAHDQRVVVKWTLIDGAGAAQAFAEKLAEAPFSRARRTLAELLGSAAPPEAAASISSVTSTNFTRLLSFAWRRKVRAASTVIGKRKIR